MTGIIIALLMIGGSIAGIVWWQTQRPRPALPPVVPPPPASAAPPISAPPPVPDAADPRRIAAEQTLARLQAATTALFGSEYLAASQVTAWQQAHPQTLAQATERSWLDWLSPELRPVAEQYCQPLRTLPQAIADHNAAVMRERLHEDAAAFDRVERFPLTPRQREAIVTDQDTTLVIAGAGTGKTSTIVGKVDYLIRRQLAAPDEILVLAYGKKAQEELQERLRALGHGQGVTISTFHALGLKIIRQAQQRPIRTTPLTEDAARHRFLQDIVTESWSDPVLQPILRDFFSTMLEAESPDAQQKHRTITGEVLRSGEEVQIATWLTLHGIRWAYERPYPIDTTTAGRRQYLPDFYLPDYDLYLEHFGIDRQGRTRADIDARQYQADMAWKRELHRTHGTRLLETFSYMTTEGGLPRHLAHLLPAAGVPCTLLPPDQLAALLQDPTTPANAFIRLLDQFLQLVGGSEDSLDTITQRAQTSRDQAFLTIFRAVYQRYQAQLAKTELLDFSSMITDARTALQSRAYVSRFRYVIVDEFQDISRQRLGLLQDLRAHVPHARLFAVGDDWQAIYRFAGSDVSIITSLPTLVGPTATVALDTTFRYPQEILDASARFVTQNPAQLTKQLRAYGGAAGVPPLVLVHQANDTPDAQTDALQAICADLMQQCAGAPASLLVLGRYRRSAPADLEPLTERLGRVGITTTYQTMHASKGKEADYVLIIGLETGRLSFPSTIPDDPVVRLVLPASETYPFAEERRLYYVALTRARKRVYLLIPPSQVSPFVTELLGPAYASYRTTLVDKPAVYPCSVCQQKTIQAVPGPRGVRWRCTAEPACDGMLTTCPACTMGAMLPTPGPEPAERCAQCGHTARQCPQCRQGILVERTSKHGVFLACSAWRGGDGCRYTQSLSMPPARPNANRPVPPRAQGGPPR